jgi:hypothetical protein
MLVLQEIPLICYKFGTNRVILRLIGSHVEQTALTVFWNNSCKRGRRVGRSYYDRGVKKELAMVQAGSVLRVMRERRGLTMRDVESASEKLSRRRSKLAAQLRRVDGMLSAA